MIWLLSKARFNNTSTLWRLTRTFRVILLWRRLALTRFQTTSSTKEFKWDLLMDNKALLTNSQLRTSPTLDCKSITWRQNASIFKSRFSSKTWRLLRSNKDKLKPEVTHLSQVLKRTMLRHLWTKPSKNYEEPSTFWNSLEKGWSRIQEVKMKLNNSNRSIKQ